MNIDGLITATVSYLREIGAFNGWPRSSAMMRAAEAIDIRGTWDQYEGSPLFTRDVVVDFHEIGFKAVDDNLKRAHPQAVLEFLLANIPDDPDTVVLEVGAGYGNDMGGVIAKEKPRSRVVLVDRGWKEKRQAKYLFDGRPHMRRKIVFKEGRELLREPNLVKRVNGLYRANGLGNVQFVQQELKYDQTVLRNRRGKKVNLDGNLYVIGERSVGDLSLIAAYMYRLLEGEMFVNSQAQQRYLKPKNPIWGVVKTNLDLTDEEIAGYQTSIKELKKQGIRWDYSSIEQARIGIMLKLGITLAIAKEARGEVFRIDGFERGYSQPDHYILARKS